MRISFSALPTPALWSLCSLSLFSLSVLSLCSLCSWCGKFAAQGGASRDIHYMTVDVTDNDYNPHLIRFYMQHVVRLPTCPSQAHYLNSKPQTLKSHV